MGNRRIGIGMEVSNTAVSEHVVELLARNAGAAESFVFLLEEGYPFLCFARSTEDGGHVVYILVT